MHRVHDTAGLLEQPLFAPLVVAEFLRQLFRRTGQCQLLLLLAQAATATEVQFGQVVATVAQPGMGARRHRQYDLGIAQVEEVAPPPLLQYAARQGQVASPGGNGGHEPVVDPSAKVAHRYPGQCRQALDDQRMGNDAAAVTLPGLPVGGRIQRLPATFPIKPESIEQIPSPPRRSTTLP
ncbi:hypothetical protein D3C84_776940 [compost metagenome]